MQGFDLLNTVNISNYNPMQKLNQAFQNSKMNIENQLGNSTTLNGHVQIEIPKDLSKINDKQLVGDLKQVMDTNAVGSDVNSPDNFVKSLNRAMGDGLQKTNALQLDAERKSELFAAGGNIDIHTVMIASQKAGLSLEMASQLRNKFVNAYKEITKMQV